MRWYRVRVYARRHYCVGWSLDEIVKLLLKEEFKEDPVFVSLSWPDVGLEAGSGTQNRTPFPHTVTPVETCP